MTVRKIIELCRFDPSKPTFHGPLIEVLADRLVAVEHAWNSHRQEPCSRIHLMGGTEFLVFEAPEKIWALL